MDDMMSDGLVLVRPEYTTRTTITRMTMELDSRPKFSLYLVMLGVSEFQSRESD